MAASRFTADRRARLLGLIEAGVSIEEASERVGVTPKTVRRWVLRGEHGEDDAAGSFADALEAARVRAVAPLGEADLVRVLEAAARRGSIRAAELLLRRLPAEPIESELPVDPFGDVDSLFAQRAWPRTRSRN